MGGRGGKEGRVGEGEGNKDAQGTGVCTSMLGVGWNAELLCQHF